MNRSLSKTQQKGEAQMALVLTEQLLALTPDELDQVPLNEDVREAIGVARGITAHGGLKRQRKYVAQLLRELDLEPIVQALAPIAAAKDRDKNEFKLIEQWRDRLLAEGSNALVAFKASYTCTANDELDMLLQQAQQEHRLGKPPRAQRQLFRVLKQCITEHNKQRE